MANNIEDAYAPNWRPYFTEQGRLISDVNLAVDCGICGNKLAITQPDNDDNETFAVLPCGHVFGYRCISQWLHRSQSPTCPTCRRSLQHLICGHKIRPRQILGTEFNIHRDLEVVIEDGEDLPGRCASCQAELDRRRNAPHQPSELEQQFVRMIREAERAADQPRPENPLEVRDFTGRFLDLEGPHGGPRRPQPSPLDRYLARINQGARAPRPRVNVEEGFRRMRLSPEVNPPVNNNNNHNHHRCCSRCHRPHREPLFPLPEPGDRPRYHERPNHNDRPALNAEQMAARRAQPRPFFVHPYVQERYGAGYGAAYR